MRVMEIKKQSCRKLYRFSMLALSSGALALVSGFPLHNSIFTAPSWADVANTPDVPPLSGRLVLKSMPLSSILKRKITTWVYLPPNYDTSSKRYPVMYLLHGQPGGWTDCYRSGRVEEMADKLISAGKMPPVILVAFDGDGPNGVKDLTNFCNRVDGYRTEDFIVQELVPYIDATYRTLPNAANRALWGYSSGGYGALNLGIKHPDVWNVLCSHAGFYQPSDDDKVMNKVLGPPGPNGDANNTLVNVKKLPDNAPLHFYLDASPNEEGYDGFQQLVAQLKARHIDVDTDVLKKAHAWRIIVQNCRESLLFAGQCFNAAANEKEG